LTQLGQRRRRGGKREGNRQNKVTHALLEKLARREEIMVQLPNQRLREEQALVVACRYCSGHIAYSPPTEQ
jgi:hypothetical protein